jgi:TRAP-type C4-dicarboxylate transport system permease small subunit
MPLHIEGRENLNPLKFLANVCAILAGSLLTLITLVTCANLILRNTTGDSMAGAFEITAMATGAAVSLFMPLAQMRQGHIIVDFFTAGLSEKANANLDRFGALVLACVFGLMAWRTTIGGISSYNAGSQTMLMGIPEWIEYLAMTPPFALTCIIGLRQALIGFNFESEHHA